MSTELIVRFCAPTLAGLKVGNLFSYRYEDPKEVIDTIAAQNELLNSKGVYFVLVKMRDGCALIYVYREKQLETLLADPEVQRFLRRYGYSDFRIQGILSVLREKLLQPEFPHDIGVFLGYPLTDVQAFIDNRGANPCTTGCWKAYSNADEAERKFRSYKKCTQIYCRKLGEGVDLSHLTVAG